MSLVCLREAFKGSSSVDFGALFSYKSSFQLSGLQRIQEKKGRYNTTVNGDARWANRSSGVEWALTQGMLRGGVKKTDKDPRRKELGLKQKLNVWRSLMRLRFLSSVPLGPECKRISVSVGASAGVCEYPPLKHWAVHNLSDSCQLCTSIYSVSQILCQQGAQPAGMTATKTV